MKNPATEPPGQGSESRQQPNFKSNSTRGKPFGQGTTPHLEEITSALHAINPDCPRHEWVQISMALKSELGESGFPLFDGWSQGGKSYNQADCRDTWKSIRPDGGTTIRTLFGMARAAGWRWTASRTGQQGNAGQISPRPRKQPPAPEVRTCSEKSWERMEKVAGGVVHLTDPVAEPARRYLENRGLAAILDDLPDPAVLGFHPALEYWHDRQLIGVFPAIVLRVQDVAGFTVCLHRIYLTPDGYKANVPEPKKLMVPVYRGATQGAAIRLYQPAGKTLHVSEGIETCLAVRLRMKLAVWSTITAGGMAALHLPDQIRNVKIWADLDRSGAGQNAAETLAKRLDGEGRTVHILTPPGQIPEGDKSLDWLDIWNRDEGLA